MTVHRTTRKKLVIVVLALSLLSSAGTIMKADAQTVFLEIDLSETPNPGDFPVGIECGDPNFVYATIFNQGALAKINKLERDPETGLPIVEEIINDPEGEIAAGQAFYSIARDPDFGFLFINELDSGRLWRFDPSAPLETAWTVIAPIVGINNADSFGTVVFANEFIWYGLTSKTETVNDVDFSGVVRVDPISMEATAIEIEGSDIIAGMNRDLSDPTILWIADITGDKVYKFNTNSLSVVQTVPLSEGSFPKNIDTDFNSVFVALNKPGDADFDFEPDGNNEIARINKSTFEVSIIDTEVPMDVDGSGTFNVVINNNLLVWTSSLHIGTIDLITDEKTSEQTDTLNFFGCVPVSGELWFTAVGSALVGILPNSKFSVGVGVGRARPTGGGGHGGRYPPFANPNTPNYDNEAPLIGEVFTIPGSLNVYAEISDKVGVKDANIILDKKTAISMEFHMGSVNWWFGTIPSSKLPSSGTLFFKIVARDFNDNVAEYSGSAEVPAGSSSMGSGIGEGAFVISALPYLEQQMNPAYSITANIGEFDSSIPATITIKNTSNEQLQNIRIMLSPELKGKFLLSEYAIKSIDPNSEYTVSIILNGKSNVDAMKQPIQYRGQIIISVDNRTPYIYELSGKAPNDYSLNLFMNNIMSKAEQRYKTFEKPDLRISDDANYQITLGSGNDAIRSASDELIIMNIGDKPLKNLRIVTSTLGNHFLPDQKNVSFIPAGSYVKVKLLSNLNNNESPDLYGQLLVVPEVGMPVTIPIEIGKVVKEDKNSRYEVTTISGDNVVSNTADAIIIRNNSDESINNVRIILPKELTGVFSLSDDSFKYIEPNDEKIVHLQQRGTMDSVSKQILTNYHGEIIILSENGMKKLVPVEIAWKSISSKHFIVYARNNADELIKATHLINFLERNYGKVVEIIGAGTTNTKTVIYMSTSLDEIKKITDTQAMSTYLHGEDIAFVYSKSEDINALALKEFVYRMVMKNYATYWTNQKISMDKGNWLIDGLSNYIAARIVGERGIIEEQINAFADEPIQLEWYGAGTLSQYGATYTFFEFLSEKYGDMVIDKTLYYLGSSMISNHRCDTFEQCTLLRAVYDVKGLDINEKRHDFTFNTIIEEWQRYLSNETGKMN